MVEQLHMQCCSSVFNFLVLFVSPYALLYTRQLDQQCFLKMVFVWDRHDALRTVCNPKFTFGYTNFIHKHSQSAFTVAVGTIIAVWLNTVSTYIVSKVL